MVEYVEEIIRVTTTRDGEKVSDNSRAVLIVGIIVCLSVVALVILIGGMIVCRRRIF